MKIIGIILIAWGILDIGLSWIGIDLYGKLGITVPEAIYRFTPFIPIILGSMLMKSGGGNEEE